VRPVPYPDLVARLGPNVEPIRKPSDAPVALHAHALDNLRYIRETMERAGSFTAVPGWGGVAMGATALAAAGLASHASSHRAWLTCWLLEGMVAVAAGVVAMARKAGAAGLPMWNAPARKFLFSFLPPLIAGAVLTLVLWQAGAWSAIPGTWLMLYGAGVIAGGAFSVPVVPVMGACFLATGVLAVIAPFFTAILGADFWLGLGFGALHVVFGAVIARKSGG
jgi:hypothetical protein